MDKESLSPPGCAALFECCHDCGSYGVDGRVIIDYPARPFAAPAFLLCDTGRLPTYKPHADYRWSSESEIKAVHNWYRTEACELPDFRRQPDGSYRLNEKCIGPLEGRAERARERRNARRRELYRQRRDREMAALMALICGVDR